MSSYNLHGLRLVTLETEGYKTILDSVIKHTDTTIR